MSLGTYLLQNDDSEWSEAIWMYVDYDEEKRVKLSEDNKYGLVLNTPWRMNF